MEREAVGKVENDPVMELIRSIGGSGYRDALWDVRYLLQVEYLAAVRVADPARAAVLRRLSARLEDAEVVHRLEGLTLTQQMAQEE